MKCVLSIAKDIECQNKIIDLVLERMDKLGAKDNATLSRLWNEVIVEHPEWFKMAGVAEKDDVDLAIGNAREDGIRIADANKLFKKENNDGQMSGMG